MTSELTYIGVFVIVGLFTFVFRAIFLFSKPNLFKNGHFKNGLDSVPSALLVALVIPYTFFSSGVFLPFRIEVLAIVLTIPIIYYLKKPGLSLPIAISILAIITAFVTFFPF